MSIALTYPEVGPTNRQPSLKSKGNGLWSLLYQGYNNHVPIILTPDAVFNTICAIWSKYIFLHAEEFRDRIVTHEGKKALVYMVESHEFDLTSVEDHMNAFIRLIAEDANTSVNWMKADFTTTTTMDRLVRQTAILASQKQFYEYRSVLCCGFPEIVFAGTPEDWSALSLQVQDMPVFNEGMMEWLDRLVALLEKMRRPEAHRDYWQAPFTEKRLGSGQQCDFIGWATVFSPFTEKGEWHKTTGNHYVLPDDGILNLEVDFEIALYDQSGNHYDDLLINAGPTEVMWNENRLTSGNHFSFSKRSTASKTPTKDVDDALSFVVHLAKVYGTRPERKLNDALTNYGGVIITAEQRVSPRRLELTNEQVMESARKLEKGWTMTVSDTVIEQNPNAPKSADAMRHMLELQIDLEKLKP